jgi:large subunit ribosomal protein L18
MARTSQLHAQYLRRVHRTRTRLAEHPELPRLSVHRSLRAMYAQIIDDATGKTLASVSTLTLKPKGTKSEQAAQVGAAIAAQAKDLKITAVRFDRGGRLYHGRVAAVAAAAREAGLTF